MSLTPKKIMDKNGHLVTRHVREDKPASMIAASLRVPRLDTSLLARIQSESEPVHFQYPSVSKDLKDVIGGKFTYTVDATDDQIYDVFSIVGQNDAIALLDAEFCSRDETLDYLLDHDLGHLRDDKREMVAELKSKGISGVSALKYYDKSKQASHSRFIIEGIQTSELVDRETDALPRKYFDLVCDGRVSLDDINEVGADNISRAYREMGDDVVATTLQRISAEESAVSTQHLKHVIESVMDGVTTNLAPYRNAVSKLLEAGLKVGGDSVVNLKNPFNVGELLGAIDKKVEGVTAEDIAWIDDYYSLPQEEPNYDRVGLMKIAKYGSITPEQAHQGYKDGLNAHQIMGVSEGVRSSVSDGWL